MNAHLRTAAALAAIDEYDDLPTNHGALPAVRIRGWDEDDRDDDIGDELADREER